MNSILNLDEEDIITTNLDELSLDLPEKWIINRLNQTALKVNKELEKYNDNNQNV